MVQPDEVHALYRFFGPNDELLYIGITYDLPLRIRRHSKGKPWWTQISRIGVESHPNRRAVLEAEKRAIIAEQPRWNIQHNTSRPTPANDHPYGGGGLVEWRCDHCGWPASTSGLLYIDLSEVREVEARVAEWERRHSKPPPRDELDGKSWLESLIRLPDLAAWRVACDECADETEWSYSISLEQCQTLAALIRWTAHLWEKNWFRASDWMGFIVGVANATGSPGEPVGVMPRLLPVPERAERLERLDDPWRVA